MYRGRSNITLGAHVATHYRDLEDSESDEDVDGIEYIGQIRGPREASSLVGNAAARGGAIRQENQQTEYGSLSVERGLYGGQTEEEDKTGQESRGQMVQGYAIGVGSGASTRAQGNRDTRTPPSPAGISPVQRSSPSPSSPSIAPLLARHDPSRLLIQSLDDPSPQTPTSSFPLVRHDPNPDQPNSPPASYAAAYNYYQSYYMSYFRGPHLPPAPPPMYGYPYPYPPPMGYPGRGGYDDGFDPVRAYPPHPSMAYGMYPYYGRAPPGGSDGMYRSPNSDSPPPRRELSHNRQKNGEHVPRPKNAFIFYRSHLIRSQAIPHSLEPDHRNLSRIAGEMWKKLGDTEREIYVEMARKEKEEHKKKYPNYRYSPAQRTVHHTIPVDGHRRRVTRNENADKEEKRRCAEMANLVAAGIEGPELEAAMKEKGFYLGGPPSSGMKRKRARREPESEEDEPSPPPQPAPAYRSAVPSVMRGPEPEAKTASPEVERQVAPAPDQQYWASSQFNSATAAAPQPFYAGHDDPSAFILSRSETATTNMEPFALLAEQTGAVVDGNAGGNSDTHSTIANGQDKPNLTTDSAATMATAQHNASKPQSVMLSHIDATNSQGVVMTGGDMTYYLRGMHQMDGFVASAAC